MATNYPGSLDTSSEQPSPSASTEMDDAGFEHDVVHTNHSEAIIALETKLGTGSSTAAANSVLAGTGAGTSSWTTGALANDISGNAATATALETARTIDITGDITAAAVAFDGTSNIAISAAVNNDSHTHDTQYVKLTGSTMTGELQLNARLDIGDGSGGNHEIRIYKSDNDVSDHIQFFNGTTRVGEIGCEDTTWLRINQETAKDIYTPRMIRADGGYQAKDGTIAAPAYTFFNDTNTGMYRYGTDGIGFSNAGGLKVLIDNGGSYGRLFGPGFRTGSAIIRGEASEAIPTYTFYSDEDTGMYRVTTNTIGFSCAGGERLRIGTYGLLVNSDGNPNTGDAVIGGVPGSTSSVTYAFNSDGDTGMYREETDMLGFSAGGEVVGLFRESTNNNTGSAGDGYVSFSTYMGGSTGTSAVIATTTISGKSVKRLMFNSSGDEAKDTPVAWEMSDESYKKIAVSSFHYNDMYVDDDGMHHHWDKASALKGEQEDEPPETWVPLKRHGFMWSQIMEHEDLWPLATDLGISDPAVAAATVSVVQRLIDRVAALEAA